MNEAQSPFSLRTVIGLIAAAVIAFGALLILLAYAEEPGPPGEDGRAAPSRSAVGYAGLVQLARLLGEVNVTRNGEPTGNQGLLVVAVNGRGGPDAIAELLRRRQGRATLLILPKWYVQPDRDHRGWVRVIGPGAGAALGGRIGQDVSVGVIEGAPERVAPGEGDLTGIDLPAPVRTQVIRGRELSSLASLPSGEMLLAQIGDEPHYILADPDFMNNHGLRDPGHARAALRLLNALNPLPGRAAIDFDLETNGVGGRRPETPSLLQLAFQPPLLAMTLALFVAALLAGYYGAFRFGPPRREQRAIAFGKAALVENSAGLIRLAKREARLGGAYVDVVRTDAARLAGAPAWLSGDKLDAYLDRLGRAGEARFTQLAAAVSAASDRASLMAAARALHEWRRGLVK